MSLFGDILGAAVDVVALPIKIGEEVVGMAIGTDGDGLKKAMPVLSDVTDAAKEIIERADGE